MHFAYPWVLLLLVGPAALLVWQWRHPGTTVPLPFDHGRVRSAVRAGRWVSLAAALPALAAAAGVLLLARPQRLHTGVTQRQLRTVQLLVDVSGSMLSRYGEGTRFDGAMAAVGSFVERRKGDAFAFSVFGTDVIDWLPPTRDTDAIRLAGPFVHPRIMPGGMSGTFIGNALREVTGRLARRSGDRMLVLITDGQSADLGGQRTAVVAAQLRAAKITVFGVFVGDNESTEDLEVLARETGGAVFRPDNPVALEQTFKRIDAMTPATFEPVDRVSIDWPVPVVVLLSGLTVLHAGCAFGLRYTPW